MVVISYSSNRKLIQVRICVCLWTSCGQFCRLDTRKCPYPSSLPALFEGGKGSVEFAVPLATRDPWVRSSQDMSIICFRDLVARTFLERKDSRVIVFYLYPLHVNTDTAAGTSRRGGKNQSVTVTSLNRSKVNNTYLPMACDWHKPLSQITFAETQETRNPTLECT